MISSIIPSAHIRTFSDVLATAPRRSSMLVPLKGLKAFRTSASLAMVVAAAEILLRLTKGSGVELFDKVWKDLEKGLL